jgi:hypothetical protein
VLRHTQTNTHNSSSRNGQEQEGRRDKSSKLSDTTASCHARPRPSTLVQSRCDVRI